MPQLMPLNWVISSVLILLIVISMCMIYGESKPINEVVLGVKSMEMNWCW